MSNELMPISSVQEKLREKVQAHFLELLPPEAFDKYVAQAWDAFLKPREIRNYGGRVERTEPSELEGMIRVEVRAVLQNKVKAWAAAWANSEQADAQAQELLRQMTEVASTAFLRSVAAEIVARAVEQVAQGIVGSCSSCGRSPVVKGAGCPNCGTWNY